MAEDLGLQFNPKDFNFSHKWLLNFKKANDINRTVLHGEGEDADLASVQVVRQTLPPILADVPLHKIFNFDETGVSLPAFVSSSVYIHDLCA